MAGYEVEEILHDTQTVFKYDLHYKTVIENKLYPIMLLKQFNVPYKIDINGKIHIKEA